MILLSSCHADLDVPASERVTFTLPSELGPLAGKPVRYVRLDRNSSVHDRIRQDLAEAGLLQDDFISRPNRLGAVREMGLGREAECLVGQNQARYDQLWIDSLTLNPLADGACSISNQPLSADLRVPGVLLLSIEQ